MSYNKTVWENLPSTNTPLSANNFNKIESELELLGGKAVTISNEDLDNYTTEGIYYFDASYTPTGIPAGVNGWLMVFSNGNFIKQIWYRHGSIAGNNDFETYVRTRVDSSTWSNWHRYIIEDEIYYKNGDAIIISGGIFSGDISGSSQNIRLLIPTSKNLKNISSFNVTTATGNIRGNSGYIDSDYTATTSFVNSPYTPIIYKNSDNLLVLNIEKNSAFNNATNNTPVTANLTLQINLS